LIVGTADFGLCFLSNPFLLALVESDEIDFTGEAALLDMFPPGLGVKLN